MEIESRAGPDTFAVEKNEEAPPPHPSQVIVSAVCVCRIRRIRSLKTPLVAVDPHAVNLPSRQDEQKNALIGWRTAASS